MQSGLLPLPEDFRDYSYAKTFGGVISLDLPAEYIIAPLAIKDQGNTDFCTGYASAAVSEDQEGMLFSGDWQIAKIKELLGDYRGYGSDLRTAAKSCVKFGSLPIEDVPKNMEGQDRDYLANWKNWPYDSEYVALPYRKEKFFKVDLISGKDLFDSIRNAMWQNRQAKRSILTGAMWHSEWTYAPNGIVPVRYSKEAGLHAFKLIGWKRIANIDYIAAQNSYGTGIGDGGIFYFPREVVNREFNQGLYMFIDLPEGVQPKASGNFLQLLIQKLLSYI